MKGSLMTSLKNSELNIIVIILMKCYYTCSLNKKIMAKIIIKIVLENKALIKYFKLIIVYSILNYYDY